MSRPPAQMKSPPAELQSPPIENFLATVLSVRWLKGLKRHFCVDSDRTLWIEP